MSLEDILKDDYSNVESISMLELLEAQRENEKVAQALSMYAGEERMNQCTYSKGYLTQPVYACLTCMRQYQNENKNESKNESKNENENENENKNKNKNKKEGIKNYSGVCLGCAMNCHLKHDIIELWERRHFRCDCGNDKFRGNNQQSSTFLCQTCPIPKDSFNEENEYHENFIGKYCYCHQEYQPSIHCMIQCLRCQNWFHDTCIESLFKNPASIVSEEVREELNFVCKDCVMLCPFLWQYRHINENMNTEHETKSTETINETENNANNNHNNQNHNHNSDRNNILNNSESCLTTTIGQKRKLSEISQMESPSNDANTTNVSHIINNFETTVHEPATKKRRLTKHDNENMGEVQDMIKCTNTAWEWVSNGDQIKPYDLQMIGGGIWMRNHWTEDLCDCDRCRQLYVNCGCSFLIENEERMEMLDFRSIANSTETEKSKKILETHQSNNDEFSMEALENRLLQRLPREQILQGIRMYDIFAQQFKENLKKYVTNKRKQQQKINGNDSNTCTLNAGDIQVIMQNLQPRSQKMSTKCKAVSKLE